MAEMKREIEHKQKKLNESESRRSNADSKTETNTTKRWQRVHKMTVGTRRILVNEVVALFQLKPGVVEEETVIPAKESLPFAQLKDRVAVEDLYICGVTLPSRLIDVSSKFFVS